MSRRNLLPFLMAIIATFELSAEYHLKSTKNVGYPQEKLPVPNTCCLDSNALKGQTTTIYFGSAVEPSIAINPKDSHHIVACWLQDQIDNGGALEIGIAYTSNQGESWKRSEIPVQICMGGSKQRVTSASLAWSADGSRVYLSGIAVNANAIPNARNQQAVFVTVSDDGGKTWSNPDNIGSSVTTLNSSHLFAKDEKISITTDPQNPLNAFAVWHRYSEGLSHHSDSMICRTSDAGATWSALHLLYNPFRDLCSLNQSNCIENNCQITKNLTLVLPERFSQDKEWKNDKWGDNHNKADRFSGDLLHFVQRKYATVDASSDEYVADTGPIQYQHTLFDIAMVRSQDKGKTWDPGSHVLVPATPCYPALFSGGYDSEYTGSGTHIHTDGQTFSCALNKKNGFLYVVYQAHGQINLLTSRDGGYSWSHPVEVSLTPNLALNRQAFAPSVAVTDDGHVGILYSDFRFDNTLNLDETKTDKWLAVYKEHSDEHGGSTGIGLNLVKEVRLTDESYVAQNGPKVHDKIFSDASTLISQGNSFYAIYTKTHSGPFFEVTDIARDPASNTAVVADFNQRQSPYVSIIKP